MPICLRWLGFYLSELSRSTWDSYSAQGVLDEVSGDVSISETHYKLACSQFLCVSQTPLQARTAGVDKPRICVRQNARLDSTMSTKDKLWHQGPQSRHKSWAIRTRERQLHPSSPARLMGSALRSGFEMIGFYDVSSPQDTPLVQSMSQHCVCMNVHTHLSSHVTCWDATGSGALCASLGLCALCD